MPVTPPPDIVAVPVAAEKAPPPEKVTVGALVYPVPAAVIVAPVIRFRNPVAGLANIKSPTVYPQ